MTHPLNLKVLPAAAAGATTIVFAHGYGCDQSMWQEVAQALPDTRRVLFDWPGAGQADPSAYDAQRHSTLEGYADDLLALLEELDLHDAVVVGHSVAASIVALAARRQPQRFGMLALLAPSPCFINDPPDYMGGFEQDQLEGLVHGLAEGLEAWSRAIAPVVVGNADRPALTERLAESFCTMDPTIALRWAKATFLCDLRPQMGQVQVPSLVMQSRDDNLAPEAVGRWLADTLPVSRYALLQALGHCPHLSAPAEVAQVLQAHLSWRG